MTASGGTGAEAGGEGARVAALFVYPVKALRGIATDAARVTREGLALDAAGERIADRRWMIVDAEGRFLTQREHPSLARIRLGLDGATLVVGADGFEELRLPPAPEGPRREVRVWRHRGQAVDGGEAAAAWMSACLGRPARLVWMPGDVVRPVNPAHARPGDAVHFADGYPILIVTEASIEGLAERLGAPVDPRQFRPNLVIRGTPPHDEDGWATVALGHTSLRIAKPCDRCMVVNVEPQTGEKGKEPLRTLETYRRVGDAVLFGVNAIPDGEGPLRVGDPVRVLSRR